MSKGLGKVQYRLIEELTVNKGNPIGMAELVTNTGYRQQSIHRAFIRLLDEGFVKVKEVTFKKEGNNQTFLKNVYIINI